MRCLLMLLLLYCLLHKAVTRPSESQDQENEGEVEEADYDKNDESAPKEAHDDDDAPLNEQGTRDDYQEDGVKQTRVNRNEYLINNGHSTSEERTARKDAYDNFPEYDLGKKKDPRDDPASQHDDPPTSKHRQADRYVGPHDTNDQLVPNSDNPSSSFDDNQMQNDVMRSDTIGRRRSGAQPEDDSELLFENRDNKREQVNKVKKNEHNDDESADPNEQSHLYRKYNNPLQNENKELEDNRNYDNRPEDANRDRRESQALSVDSSETKDKKGSNNDPYEDDQAAIKRHIKKLSNDELDELLSSLTEDKRVLLQKIIESDANNEKSNFNKREITKKAGAVEENIFLEGGQDANKVSGPALNINSENTVGQNTDNTESTKTIRNAGDMDMISTKSFESSSVDNFVNKESTHSNEESVTDKLESINLNSIASPPAELEKTKNENKREVDLSAFSNEETDNDLNNESQDPSSYQSYVCSQDNDLSQLIDDEVQLHYDNRNMQKRDTFQESNVKLSDSMKSLQDSFPNSNSYDDSGTYAGSDMAPLIRVKRRNNKHAVEKRAAAVLPESNVAYVPYRAENEDEDNDEGNEFYDDGFFDRTASFAKSNGNKRSESRRKLLKDNSEDKLAVGKRSNLIGNHNSDTMSVGSDTDSVLSGVEGVDDNLMLNGLARMKRAAEKGSKLEPAEDLIKENMFTCPQRSTTSGDSTDKSESFSDGINFDGKDAFGPLPRNYDGELSRYKRIRRLKQPVDTKEVSSTEAT